MTDPQPDPQPPTPYPPTICKCGLAKSYHGPNPPNLADHEYEPRYAADSQPPMSEPRTALENDIRELRGAEPRELARRLIERGWSQEAADRTPPLDYTSTGPRQRRIDAERALNRLVPLLPSTPQVHEDYRFIRAALGTTPEQPNPDPLTVVGREP